MRIFLLAALPILIAAGPSAEKRAPIDDPMPKPAFLVDCASSYQRPCLCKSSMSSPPATCGWGESCVSGANYSQCQKGLALTPVKK